MKLIFLFLIVLLSILFIASCYGDMIDDLVPLIIACESSRNPNAVSEDGCIGLMQISPIVLREYKREHHPNLWKHCNCDFHKNGTWKELDMFDMCETGLNIEVGTWYLRRIWNHYLPHYKLKQSIENLCISYHDGPKNCWKYRQGKRKLGPEMRNYLKKIEKLRKQ